MSSVTHFRIASGLRYITHLIEMGKVAEFGKSLGPQPWTHQPSTAQGSNLMRMHCMIGTWVRDRVLHIYIYLQLAMQLKSFWLQECNAQLTA